MTRYIVRVTRDLDEDAADVEVHADDWAAAKERAIAEVLLSPDTYFGDVPKPRYYVDSADDDEEAANAEGCD